MADRKFQKCNAAPITHLCSAGLFSHLRTSRLIKRQCKLVILFTMATSRVLQRLNALVGASRGARLITYCNLGKSMLAGRFSALGDTVFPVPVSFGRSYFKA